MTDELLSPDEYLSAAQAAREIGVTLQAIRNAARDGRLLHSLVLGRIVIKRIDLEAYRQRSRGPNGEKPAGRPRKAQTIDLDQRGLK